VGRATSPNPNNGYRSISWTPEYLIWTGSTARCPNLIETVTKLAKRGVGFRSLT